MDVGSREVDDGGIEVGAIDDEMRVAPASLSRMITRSGIDFPPMLMSAW